MAYEIVFATQVKEFVRELEHREKVFLGESIHHTLAAINDGRIKPSPETQDGYLTVFLGDSGYVMTYCHLTAKALTGRSDGEIYIAWLMLLIWPPPY